MKIEKCVVKAINSDMYRPNESSEIIGVKMVTPEDYLSPRLCYEIRFEDNAIDYIPIADFKKSYDIVVETEKHIPTEEELLNVIFESVDIRGIDLILYKRSFSNKESGLYDNIMKLFNK
jgi:hypothetical protein